MRVLSSAILTALDSGRYLHRNCVWFDLDPADGGAIGFWDDIYPVTLDGRTYSPAAGRFTLAPAQSSGDQSVRSCDITFSGLDDGVLAELLAMTWHQRPVTAWVAIAPVEAPGAFELAPWFIGFMDEARPKERIGGTSDLLIRCESISRELSRRGARTRSDADQRQLDPNDGFFKHVTQVINETPRWGRAGGGGTGGGNRGASG